MALITHKLAAATAVAAAFSLVAAPAAAVELPRVAGQTQVAKAGALDVENRRHRGRHGHRDHDDDIDGGDILAGVLILGGIAAIASAVGKNREQARYPAESSRDWDDDAGYTAPAPADGLGGGGIGRAVDKCVAEIEAGMGPVDRVEAAGRAADGWRVSGRLQDGADYWCTVDADGRVSGVGGAGTAQAEQVGDGQYDDAYYAEARAAKAQVEGDIGEDRPYAMAQAAE